MIKPDELLDILQELHTSLISPFLIARNSAQFFVILVLLFILMAREMEIRGFTSDIPMMYTEVLKISLTISYQTCMFVLYLGKFIY